MSRLAAGHPQGTGLDAGENGATIPVGSVDNHPPKSNDVPRHLSTVSRDIAVVAGAGIEPATSG